MLRRAGAALPRPAWLRWGVVALLLLAALSRGLMVNASGAIAVGNKAGNYDYNTTTITWSHTIPAGTDRILVVRVGNIGSTITVSSVTYGGTAMTSLASATSGSGASQVRASIWYMLAPPVGTATVLVTLSAKTWAVANSDNYTGVSQYAPFGTSASAAGSSTSPSVTVTSAAGDLVLDAGAAQGPAGASATGGSGQTANSGGTGTASTDVLIFLSTKAGAASTTMSWTLPNSAPWVDLAVALKPSYTVSGTVFEDVNYGGGSGRNLATSAGSGLTGSTVELYSSGGSYLASTTTASGGGYTFTGLSGSGSYFVRVVNSTVASQRSGSTGALLGVQTYRTNASSGSAVDVTDNVGGTNPASTDPGAASSGAAFNTSTFVFSAGLSGTAQSVAPLTVSGSNVTGLDFGFNFDTVVNTNDTGPGSLRQAITNANTLGGDASLAQSGRTAAIENLVFMISNGTAGSGLRSAYNYFTTSAGSYNVATISPASLLPTLTSALVMDAQTQPGWTLAPLIELNGTSAGGSTTSDGLQPLASNCVIRGFVINRFSGEGIYSSTGNNLTIQGNYIGTNAAGTAASANNRSGIYISTSASTGHQIGGTTAAQRNVLSGNLRSGLALGSTSSTLVQGNYIGVNVSASGLLGNGMSGLDLGTTASGNTIGGTATGAANVIAGNGQTGINVPAGASGNTIEGNSIYGNGGIGIDLNDDGVTVNTGAEISGKGNLDMNYPVFTQVSLSGTTLTLAGYVGSAAGQTAFANARVEVFISDNDSSGYGQGKTYLGFLTTDANGNINGTISGVSGVTIGSTRVTGTATDSSGNTSEFGPNYLLTYILSGTVFEDVNYGGGSGRSLAASAGVGLNGVTVELYSSAGVWLGSTTTTGSGTYSLTGVGTGTYYVRVVNSTADSQRSGSVASLTGVMTYRTDASSGSPVAVTNYVGGTNPALVDPGAGSSGTTLNTSTAVFTAGLSGTAQSLTTVTVGSSGIGGIDFGFNFDTVVNTNVTGQGSLYQALTNANTLGGDSGLSQSGRTAGIENIVFMIPNGTAASGLRSSYNYFTTSAGSYNVATITASAAFPTLTAPVVMDAQTQPGWSASPIIEINGNSLSSTLFTISGGNSIFRGFVINRLATNYTSALRLDTAGGNTVQGNWLGPDASGATATTSTRVSYQIQLYSGGNTIGGSGSTQRNVISNAASNGIVIWSGSANTIQGNYIGTNAAGSAALASGDSGIVLPSTSTATNTVIGGVGTGQGNVISGNTGTTTPAGGIAIQGSGSTGTVIQGNSLGLNAAGTGTIASGGYGVYVASAGTTIGGTATGAGNVIAGFSTKGIAVVGTTTTGVTIEGNSIYGNTTIGIDLNNDGATANSSTKTSNKPNLLMDSPVFTTASLSGTTLTLAGYVGSAAGQSAFAGARVEVFISDASNTAGQGKTYLGFLTSDASGNLAGTLSGVSGLTAGTSKITGTATDSSGNTSEFGANFLVTLSLAGTVFEDSNYGGGAGRSLAASGGSGVAGATVELYSSAGAWVGATTTATGGGYSFTGLAAGSYYVRVVNSTVASQRSGGVNTLRGVQTYRTDASSGTATAVTNYVGGTNPALVDPGAGSSGTQFNTGTDVFTSGLSGTAQSVAPVALAANASVAGVDFGFNFDTVVNTNDTGQGSLRQAMTNANTLGGDASLAQSGRAAAIENLVFMISNGSTSGGGSLGLSGGLRSAYNYFATSAGSYNVATLVPASALPVMTTPVVIDAQTQPGWTLAPLIEINAGNQNIAVFTLSGGNSILRGFVINHVNTAGAATAVRVDTLGGNTIQGNYLGPDASGATATTNGCQQLNLYSGGNLVGGATAAARNVIAKAYCNGIAVWSGNANVIKGNYIGVNAAGTAALNNNDSGIVFDPTSTATNTVIGGVNAGEGNVISGSTGVKSNTGGIAIQGSGATGTLIQGNSIGLNAAGTATIASGGYGIYVASASTTIGGTAAGAGNVITGYATNGVTVVGSTTTGVTIEGNSIYGNTGIGIDLNNDGATANSGTKTSNMPNLLMNTPVFTAAWQTGTSLTVTGYVGSTAGQSMFAGARVEVFVSDASNPSGQGKTYLGALTTNASGNFSGTLGGLSGLSAGATKITGTATDGSGNSSEFGPNFLVTLAITGTVFEDANYGGGAGRSLAASGGTGSGGATVEVYSSTGAWVGATTSASDGTYSLTGLAAGSYYVRVVNASVSSQRSGAAGTLRGVQTYRTDASSGTATAVTNYVGGTNPALVDPGAGSSGTQFTTSTGVFTAGLSGTAQSFSPATLATNTSVAGVDFGFNFDTVVNTNDSGQGSLRQAITNANTLGGDASLAQAGRTAGIENLVFMISNGSTAGGGSLGLSGGLRTTYNYFSGGVATIAPVSSLTTISTPMVIDAQTQPGWTSAPVVDLNGAGAGAGVSGLTISAYSGSTGATIRGFVVRNFSAQGVSIASGSGHLVAGCYIGTTADGTAAAANALQGVNIWQSAGNTIGGTSATARNVISGNTGNGIVVAGSGATGNTIAGNYVGTNATGTAAVKNGSVGIDLGTNGNLVGGTSAGAGNLISGNTYNGIQIESGSSGNTVQGNLIGMNALGTSALGNGNHGIYVIGTGNAIGGSASGAGNVISGNAQHGVRVDGASNTIAGNVIGLNPAATTTLANGDGVYVNGAAATTIGGTAALAGNTIAGNTGDGVTITGSGATGTLLQGNWVGTTSGGATGLGNGGNGVTFAAGAAGNTVGGSAAANVIANNTGRGVSITGASTGNAIEGNSIYGNTQIGIDLGGDGPTANTGAKTAGQPNLLMNFPVFTSATLSGTTLTLTGYVGSAASQSTFASARVEVFISDGSNPNGQGKTYLGFLTSDANGNLNGSLSGVTGITLGSTGITGTATDGSGNTSEFGPNVIVGWSIAGTVFEDANYGGGAGRSLATSGGSGVAGATVELYSGSGSWLASTTSASGGVYRFAGLAPATYYVRIVGGTVASQRSGSTASLPGVMTYRTDASSGSVVAVTNYVGGTNPALTDPGAGSSGTTVNTGTGVFSAGLSGTAQSLAPVAISAGGIAGVDFGFNFDTVVNTNDSGPGSLRQALTNANTLTGDASLAQSGRAAGIENIVFMIPNGSSSAGLRSAYNYFTTSAGSTSVATIAPLSALPTLSTAMAVDAQTQPGWGTSPIIEINGSGAGSVNAFTLGASGSTLRGFVINRYAGGDGVLVGAAGAIVQGCWIGLNAAGNTRQANGYGVVVNNVGGATLGGTAASARNVVSGNTQDGIQLTGASASTNVVQGNYIGSDATGSTAIGNGSAGVRVTAGASGNILGGSAAGAANLVLGNVKGVVVSGSGSGNAISTNRIYGNSSIGIDLGDDGATANNGVKTAGQPNLKMNAPVFTSAVFSGTTLTVTGYVGSAAGQSVFASARVEIFVSDGSNASGQGKTYLGSLTADGSGNLSGTLTGLSGLANGSTAITATATDGSGNTSEFGPNSTLGYGVSGTVFEDANYGGGAGRSLASASGTGVGGATVELYNTSGVWVASTTTAAGGAYSFAGLASATYYVRVVGGTVASQRTGSLGSLVGVMTYRTNANSGSVVAVTDNVGGTNPALADPAAGGSGAVFDTGTFVFSAGPSGTAQSVAPVAVAAANVAGIDFGFNFDTVVNTNDAGQGSLRQAITNANTLGGDAGLAQSGRTAGIENLVFMISNGGAGSGLRSAYNYFNTAAGSGWVATISPLSALPAVSTPMVIDAQTQPGFIATPVIELRGSGAGTTPGFSLSGGGTTLRGFIVNRYSGHGISLSGSGGDTVQGCWIGVNAAGTGAAANSGAGIAIAAAGGNHQIGGTGAGNLISGNGGAGVTVAAGTSGNAILANSIYGNGSIGIDLDGDGVTVNAGTKTAGQANLLMNYAVFSSAHVRGTQLAVAGYVGSAAGQSLFASSRVDVYVSDGNASGYGSGKTWLGTLTADASGNFSATLTIAANVLGLGGKLTATATDGAGDTSEFGPNFSGIAVDLVVNSNLDQADANPGDGYCLTASGVCTLRAAIAEIDAWSGLAVTPTVAFAIPGCSSYGSAGCLITPATPLPSVTQPMAIDATTQAGWNSSSAAPLVALDGSLAPASTTGLVLAANGSTLRGLAITGFGSNGVTVSGSGNLVAGNRIGLNTVGGAAGNGGSGIYLSGSGNTVGTVSAADANLIAANTGSGVIVAASGNTLQGNDIGTDASGTTGLGNHGSGVLVNTGVTGATLGADTIANNAGHGVGVSAGARQVQITANAISGNGALGIDLGNDGVTANTGTTNASLANLGMNQPVITGAGVATGSASIVLSGYVGSAAGQAAFAGARVEFFKAAVDASGYGQGQVYLGALTADSSGNFSGTISIAAGSVNVGDTVTATATDAAGDTSEFSANWVATTVAALAPGNFNAFETDAAPSAVNWVLRSKTAGVAATVAVVALDSTGTTLNTTFAGTVALSWLDARDDSGVAAGSCRSSWVNLGSAGSVVFNGSGRVSVSITPPASGTRVMRLQMSYTSSGSTVVACSNDAFAVLPASLSWINASDSNSLSAGTLRVLANTGANGGVVHNAGRPFTVRAQALDALGNVMTAYDGSPALAVVGCLLPTGCSAGALGNTTASASGGLYTNGTVTYAEVGAMQLQLTDTTYASVDSADTSLAARTFGSGSLSVGRFVPDSLSASVSTSGQLATANGACLASGQGATFIDQGFGWATPPQVTVTALNAAGATTTLWTGALMKLAAGSGLVPTLADSGAGSATLSSSYGAMSVTSLGGGRASVAASATDLFMLQLPDGTVQASTTPAWTWSLAITDASEAAVSGNPVLSTSATQNPVGFNNGALFHSGRLALSPGHGDARSGVRLLVQLQRWTSAGWITMTEDRGCVTVLPVNLGVESPSGAFASNICAAPLTAGVTTSGGRAWLPLPGTPVAAPGRLTLRLAGAAASGNSCTPAGASASLVPMGLPWLLGGSSSSGPAALATWGRPNRDAVLRHEVW